jgi:hypothetical protein
MRVGTAIFSIIAMVDRSLAIVQMTEAYANNHHTLTGCRITFIITFISIIASLVFIFMQSFFIFKFANIVINYGRNSAVIGLIHLVVTNLIVCFRTIIHETMAEIREHNHHIEIIKGNNGSPGIHHLSEFQPHETHEGHENSLDSLISSDKRLSWMNEALGCLNTHMSTSVGEELKQAQFKLAPYFYPCIIEYSLMSLTVFFILWESVGNRDPVDIPTNDSTHNKSDENLYIKQSSNNLTRGSVVTGNLVVTPINRRVTLSQLNLKHNHSYKNAQQFTVDCGN